jgi:hypothetical protein
MTRADGRIINRWQVAPNGNYGHWTGLARTPGVEIAYPGGFDSLTVAANADGRLEIVAWHSAYGVPYRIVGSADGTWRDPVKAV